MKRIIVLILGSVVASLGTGCVEMEMHEYPEGWSALRAEKGSQCPDISGTYVNLGDRLEEQSDEKSKPSKTIKCDTEDPPCFLSILFSPEYRQYMQTLPSHYREVLARHVDYLVEVRQDTDGSFAVDILNEKGGTSVNTYHRDINQGDMRCKDGAYEWSFGFGEYMGGYGLIRGSASHRLTTSEDGSLVLEVRATGGGLALVVPVYGGSNIWYKWAKYEGT